VVNVYGAPNAKDKEKFLVDLVHVFSHRMCLLVGGDFNLITKVSEWNKPMALSKWTRLFNAIIEHGELKEIEMDGRRYTWSNNQMNPTLKKLDSVLVSWSWGFPLIFIQ
jgi:hypothetical protein